MFTAGPNDLAPLARALNRQTADWKAAMSTLADPSTAPALSGGVRTPTQVSR